MLNRIFIVLIGVCIGVTLGCGDSGPSVGKVTGVVTLDGEPIDKATVSFHPTQGRGSIGLTDADGKYELRFTRNKFGALLGEHKVTISTHVFAEENRNVEYDDESRDTGKGREESMPPRYLDLDETVLKAVVEKGSNVCNFELTSSE